jgi:YbbR domain-containing protein
MKVTALAFAAILWAAVAAEEPTIQRVAVSLRVRAPEGRPLTRALPPVYGVFSGPARELLKLVASPPIVHVAIPDTSIDSVYTVQLAAKDVEIAKNIDVRPESVEPRTLTLTLENVARRMVPVVPRVTVRPDSGFAMFGGVAVTPESVLVVGSGPQLSHIHEITTLPVELSDVSGPVRRTVLLDTSGMGSVRFTRNDVEISTEVGPFSERVLMGIPVTVRGERGGGAWSSEPPAVIVTVRGPPARLGLLTRDSVEVAATAEGTGRPETVRLEVKAPTGVNATATPDTAVVQRRSRG